MNVIEAINNVGWIEDMVYKEQISAIQPAQITIKELKEEAKKKGYKLVKDVPYIKFEPCICGGNHRSHWNGLKGHRYTYDKCGLTSEWGKSERKAKELWNAMIINKKVPGT